MKDYIKPAAFFLVAVIATYVTWEFFYLPSEQNNQIKQTAILKELREKREKKIETEIAQGPQLTTHQTAFGEVIHMKVPIKGSQYSSQAEWVDCIIWRDAKLSRVSISCPTEADLTEIDFSDMQHGEDPSAAPSRYR